MPAAAKQQAAASPQPLQQMLAALRAHWPEYLMEAAELGIFMVSACLFTVVLEHPASAVRGAIASPMLRRVLIGLAMGLSAIAIIYSPWGKRSGAHFNPSVTLTFLRLGKVSPWDAAFYVAAQFLGGIAGVMLAANLLGSAVADHAVRYAATVPGPRGTPIAFIAELGISFVLMTAVLNSSNSPRLARFTGVIAGALVATFITLEAPLSGMSMNPARTFGSALPGRVWDALWIYFTAPPLGMLLASELYVRTRGLGAVVCAKLHHQNNKRCIFNCGYAAKAARGLPS
ncbi:MAG TPA: aquaporin [Terriglobales bacterium]|nr:aquaporin [Terriglobales bacterium]